MPRSCCLRPANSIVLSGLMLAGRGLPVGQEVPDAPGIFHNFTMIGASSMPSFRHVFRNYRRCPWYAIRLVGSGRPPCFQSLYKTHFTFRKNTRLALVSPSAWVGQLVQARHLSGTQMEHHPDRGAIIEPSTSVALRR